jgi:hypothetical protein
MKCNIFLGYSLPTKRKEDENFNIFPGQWTYDQNGPGLSASAQII